MRVASSRFTGGWSIVTVATPASAWSTRRPGMSVMPADSRPHVRTGRRRRGLESVYLPVGRVIQSRASCQCSTHLARPADERVKWRIAIPFFLVWSSRWPSSSPASPPPRSCSSRSCSSAACSSSPPATTATSRTELQAQPLLAVRPGVRRRDGRAEGRAVVGRAPPPPPPVLRHRARHPLAAARASGGATSAGSSATSTTTTELRQHQGLRQVPRAALPQQARLDRAVDARRRLLPDRRLAGPVRRLLRVDRAAVARDVHRELARARVRAAPLRHRRHQPQLAAHRAASPAARAGTTTTTTTRRRRARASSGGRSTSPTTCSRCSAGSAS